MLNVIKSPYDKRDLIYNSNNDKISNTLDYRKFLLPVRNQGRQGTCYAQSVACMKEWQEFYNYGLNEYLSPQFFYNNRYNLYDKIPDNDEGMFGRDVMKILKEIGICTENQYPYGLIQHKDDIPESCYLHAKKNIIQKYARINTIENLKKSLINNGPCLIAFPVYNYTTQMWIQNNNESFKGGHAMCVVGYLEDCFIIRNSWGLHWGDNGYCYYYFKDWGKHWELWTTLDKNIIHDPEPHPDPEPRPDPEPHLDPEITKNLCPKCIIQ